MTQLIEKPVFRFALQDDLKGDKKFLPTRATSQSSGWDVRAATAITARAGQYVKIPLGFRIVAPKGWWLELKPRSSSFAKKHLNCLYGTLDSDYRGICVLACQYIPDVASMSNDLKIVCGEAIGQLIPVQLQEMLVEQISNEQFDDICKREINDRGAGGFGSTDLKR